MHGQCVLLGVRAGEGRHATAEPGGHAHAGVGPRAGPSVRGHRLRRRVEHGGDRGDALPLDQPPDAEVGAIGVAGRALELEDLAASLDLDRGPLRDGEALESRVARAECGRHGGPGRGRQDPAARERVESEGVLHRRRGRRPDAVHEHVAVDHPGLAQPLAHPLASAHRGEPDEHEDRRLEATVAAGPQRDEGERGDDEEHRARHRDPRRSPHDRLPRVHRAEDGGEERRGCRRLRSQRLRHRHPRAGRDREVPQQCERDQDRRRHDPPRGRPPCDARLEVGVLQERGRKQHVQAGQAHRHRGAQHHHRQVGGVEEAGGEAARLDPAAGGEHEGEDAGDHHQAGPRGGEVDPADPHVRPRVEPVPAVVVDHRRRDLGGEERPLDRPRPDEGGDEGARGLGLDERDREPDADAGEGAQHEGEQDEPAAQVPHEAEEGLVPLAPGLSLREDEEEPPAHREVRDEDVDDGDRGDEQARGGQLPHGVVHGDLAR